MCQGAAKIMKAVLVLAALAVVARAQGWSTGRATHYGEDHTGQTDGYSIHDGSCQFGNLDPNIGTGWDIAAISDKHPSYKGSCGKCYELRCKPMIFKDNYGGTLDKRDACLDSSKSVIVTVVDVCPCHFPRNLYSNKRWCCGDMDHFDISVFAFQKLAPKTAGVIALDYREVPCPSYEPFMPTAPENIRVTTKPESELTATSSVQRVSRTSTSDTTSTQTAISVTLEPGPPTGSTAVETTATATSQRGSGASASSTTSVTVSKESSIAASAQATVLEDGDSEGDESRKPEPIIEPEPAVKPKPAPKHVKPVPVVTAKPTPKPASKPAPKPAPKPVKPVKPAAVSGQTPSRTPSGSSIATSGQSENIESETPSGIVTLSIGRWTYRVPEDGGQVTRVSRTSSTDTTSTQSAGTSVTTSGTGSSGSSFASTTVTTRGSASASSGSRSSRTSVHGSGTTTSGASASSSASFSGSASASSTVSTHSSVRLSSGSRSSSTSTTRTSTTTTGSGTRVSRTSSTDKTPTRQTSSNAVVPEVTG